MTDLPNKRYFRPDEVADQLRVTIRTVYRWIHKRELLALHFRSGTYRIAKADLDRFLVNRSSQNDRDVTVSS